MSNVIKKDQIKPITNREKIWSVLLQIFPEMKFEEYSILPCNLGLIEHFGEECVETHCGECIRKYMNMPYVAPHREHSTVENTTVDYHE